MLRENTKRKRCTIQDLRNNLLRLSATSTGRHHHNGYYAIIINCAVVDVTLLGNRFYSVEKSLTSVPSTEIEMMMSYAFA